MNNALKSKTIKEKANLKKQTANHSNELIQEVKESLDDYKKGKYVKGNVNEIMKAIRDYDNKTVETKEIQI